MPDREQIKQLMYKVKVAGLKALLLATKAEVDLGELTDEQVYSLLKEFFELPSGE